MEYNELERISELLKSCLQQIERDAMSVQHGRCTPNPEGLMAALQSDTDKLRDLLYSLLGHLEGPRDVNAATHEAVDGLLRKLEVPLVINTQLAEGLPGVSWTRDELHSGLRRALELAARYAGPGGEVEVKTRQEGDLVILELTARGHGEAQIPERCSTLQDFVDRMEGRSELRVDEQGGLHLLIGFKSCVRVKDA